MDITLLISPLISEALNGNQCKHYTSSIQKLLLTCKSLMEYLINNKWDIQINYKKCNWCGLMCKYCYKNGTLRCDKCVCVTCNQSQNVNYLAPIFNGKCYVCSGQLTLNNITQKWNYPYNFKQLMNDNPIYQKDSTKLINIINILIESTNESCAHTKISIYKLLLTCKTFIEYLPNNYLINYKNQKYNKERHYSCFYSNSSICRKCNKYGTMKCKSCVCICCGYKIGKSNLVFNQLYCRKCFYDVLNNGYSYFNAAFHECTINKELKEFKKFKRFNIFPTVNLSYIPMEQISVKWTTYRSEITHANLVMRIPNVDIELPKPPIINKVVHKRLPLNELKKNNKYIAKNQNNKYNKTPKYKSQTIRQLNQPRCNKNNWNNRR